MDLKPHQENRGNDGIFDKRNKINNLTGKEWLFSTRSVKTKEYKFIIDIEKAFINEYINFMPEMLIYELVNTFCKPNSIIIDPYCNYGSSALAINHGTQKHSYFGYNFRKTSLIGNNYPFKYNINLFSQSYNDLNKKNKLKPPNLIFSELIFSSLFPEIRIRELNSWVNSVINYLESNLQIIKSNTYIILCLQNSKYIDKDDGQTKYISNVSVLTNKLKDLNLVLKGEMIWKIPNDYIKILKSVLINKQVDKGGLKSILNDKRILVFRKEF